MDHQRKGRDEADTARKTRLRAKYARRRSAAVPRSLFGHGTWHGGSPVKCSLDMGGLRRLKHVETVKYGEFEIV